MVFQDCELGFRLFAAAHTMCVSDKETERYDLWIAVWHRERIRLIALVSRERERESRGRGEVL